MNKKKSSKKSGTDTVEIRPKTTEIRGLQSSEVNKDVQAEAHVLNAQQRMKRASAMRRNLPKLRMLKRIAASRMASSDRLQARAEILARRLVKKRVAGKRGFNYSDLGVGEKMSIDKLMIGKHPLVKAIAKRLLPKVRQAETLRLTAAHKGQTIYVNPLQIGKINSKITKDMAMGSGRNVSENKESHKLAHAMMTYKKPKKYAVMTDFARKARMHKATFASEQASLEKKSLLTGIPLNIIEEIFNRGVEDSKNQNRLTPEQYAFNRVNSFITGGKAFEMDSDLAEALVLRKVKLPNGRIILKKIHTNNEKLIDESNKTSKFRIAVTYSDPKHPSVSKRKEQVFKRFKVNTTDSETAKKIMQHHMKKKGYDIHGIDIVEEVNEMRYPPRRLSPEQQKAQDKIMKAAIEKINNIPKSKHTGQPLQHAMDQYHNRELGDSIMKKIKDKHTEQIRRRMLDQQNKERISRGLKPLEYKPLDEEMIAESVHEKLHADFKKMGMKHHDPFAHLTRQGVKIQKLDDNFHANHDPKKVHDVLVKHGWKMSTHTHFGHKMAPYVHYSKNVGPYSDHNLELHHKNGKVYYITMNYRRSSD